jgi:tetratricopeptide (TPR) repeat protein
MGVVYEAEQVSLRRRVAVKVLPFAAVLDPRQLQRFQNEAQAAACLHHTNIVPVHYVGCERGVHFYAMQFIDGQNLAALVAQLRAPAAKPATVSDERTTAYEAAPAAATEARAQGTTVVTPTAPRGRDSFRRAAELMAQAAEALDHAHQVGVVHRDVKPANLLVDAAGRLWVTDFGLAQFKQAEATLTQTGDLVGTLRYMSPEQALARRAVVDHRTDVYSLGATLYELLTLRPVFGGSDRQELLRQVAQDEPVAPRRVDRAVPAELEVVALKALEKRPEDRYATAGELAEDLRRFLRDEPVRARRPTLVQAARKWGRRHRGAVRAAGAALLAAAVVLGAGGGWVARDWAARRAQTEWAALLALEDAAARQAEGRLPEALAAAHRATWLVQAGPADEALRRRASARRADLGLARVLQDFPLAMTAVKDGRLDGASADNRYKMAFAEAGLDPEGLPPGEAGGRLRATTVAAELSAALDGWAMARRAARGPGEGSWRHLLRAARAADDDRWRNSVRDALLRGDRAALAGLAASEEGARQPLRSLIFLAQALDRTGGRREAEALLRGAHPRHPGDFWVNHELGMALMDSEPPRPAEAVRFLTAAVALRPDSRGTLVNLGDTLEKQEDYDGAAALYREAFRLEPDHGEYHRGNFGNALTHMRRLDEAVIQYQQALRPKIDDYAWTQGNRYEWIRMRQFYARLPDVLRAQPRLAPEWLAPEWLAFAAFCQQPCKGLNAAAALLYADAFAAAPRLADDLGPQHRYNAACAAALAAAGQGKDAPADDKERARLRRQALDWLRADLAAWRGQLNKAPDRAQPAVAKTLAHWQQDADFAGVRGAKALAGLPEAERQEWEKLWLEVIALRRRAGQRPAAESSGRP